MKPKATKLLGGLTLALLAAALYTSPVNPAGLDKLPAPKLDKPQVAKVLGGRVKQLTHFKTSIVRNPVLGPLVVDTTLHQGLQRWAENHLRRIKSRRVAVVVIEAATGRVLVLAGNNRRRNSPAVALDSSAPAASLFKMITAAAALERTKLKPGSRLKYAGRAHTLYRYQVRRKTRRRGRNISLKKSFAQSNNPIFARLGIHQLGGELLTSYAKAMGFGHELGFELPVGVSHLPKPSDNFEVGEMACGFNRQTTTSPLHSALMVAVFVNGGRFMEPYMIERITNADGVVLYEGKPRTRGTLLSAQTCGEMREMFAATVTMGTARKAFRRLNRDRVLKHLEVGGKTGTLRGPDRKELYEWFAGYARHPQTGRALAIATMVVHGRTRYQSPKRLARQMLREAFKVCRSQGQSACWQAARKVRIPIQGVAKPAAVAGGKGVF